MNNENKFTLILRSLDELRGNLKHEADVSIKLKQWCISIWIGILAVIATGKLNANIEQTFLLPYLPILLFFFLDIFQAALIAQLARKIYTIEQLLVSKDIEKIEVQEILLLNYTKFSTWLEKFKLYFSRMIIPSRNIFYLLLLFVTILFNSLSHF